MAIKRNERFSSLIYLLVYLPLISTLVIESLPVININSNILDYVRGSSHILFLLLLFISLFKFRAPILIPKSLIGNLLIAFLLIFFPLFSIIVNSQDTAVLGKVIIQFIYLLNLLFLLDIYIYRNDRNDILLNGILDSYILVTLIVSIVSIVLFLTEINPYSRLGYPFRPGVFAYTLMIGWIISYVIKKNITLTIFYTILLIASGSRSALAILFLLIIITIKTPKIKTLLIIIPILLILISAISLIADFEILRPYLIHRDDITSGRLSIWFTSLNDLISDNTYLFGEGVTPIIEIAGDEYGTHNSFLDLSLQYGIIYACIAYIFWFVLFFPKRLMEENELYIFKLCLFIMITLKSAVSNIFWLNLGDPATFISLLLLRIPSIHKKQTK